MTFLTSFVAILISLTGTLSDLINQNRYLNPASIGQVLGLTDNQVAFKTTTSCPAGATDAFTACYYAKSDLTDIKLTRTETSINYDWGSGSPDPSFPADGFSVRWEGNFNFEAATYIFNVLVDDGVRIYIDNQLVLDQWKGQTPTYYSVTESLTVGPHTVRVEYFEGGGGAQINFSWSKLGGSNTSSSAAPMVNFTPPASDSSKGNTIKTFNISDQFGVSYQNQIIEFDYPGASSLNPNNTCMVGPLGSKVPFQILSTNKIIVEASLSANSSKSWQLQTGCLPGATGTNLVNVTTASDYYELTNGKTGVRVLRSNDQKRNIAISSISVSNGLATINTLSEHGLETIMPQAAGGNEQTANLPITFSGLNNCSFMNGKSYVPSPSGDPFGPNKNTFVIQVIGSNCSDTAGNVVLPDTTLAPVQGVKLADGTWTGTNPPSRILTTSYRLNGRLMQANAINNQIIEVGPLRTVVAVTYGYRRQPVTIKDSNSCAASGLGSSPCTSSAAGYFTSTYTLEAGQPSILVEDDANMDLRYSFNIYDQVQVDQGRWIGWGATNSAYGTCFNNCSSTAQVRNFDYSQPLTVDNYGATGQWVLPMSNWKPWQYDTGWYWMLYNKSAPSTAPVVGVYTRSASRGIGAQSSGTGPLIIPSDATGKREAGFTMLINHGDVNANYRVRARVPWAIFVGTKGADVTSPTSIQTIGKQWNIHGGISLNKTVAYQLTYNDPPRGFGGMFLDTQVIAAVRDRLRYNDPNKTYRDTLLSDTKGDNQALELINMWADSTGVKTKATADRIVATAHELLDIYVNGAGIFEETYHYIQGGETMVRDGQLIDSVLADPLLSAADKIKVKAVAALYANILHDEDFVPLDNNFQNPLGLGTPNMPVAQVGFRNFFALLIPTHPLMAPRIPDITASVLPELHQIINNYGAGSASSHYIGAGMTPTTITMLQLKQAGIDLFASEPTVSKFAEFYMQLHTPAEVRFGGGRKVTSFGNSTTEGSDITGLLATGFANSNPTLASRLMGIWNASGKPYGSFFGTSLTMINPAAPSQDPSLGNGNFTGYMSVFRNAWNTVNESVLWLLNGDFYFDHRTDDRGGIAMYALDAPVSVQFGSIYCPSVGVGANNNLVVPLGNFGDWNQNNSPLVTANANVNGDGYSGWSASSNDTYQSFLSSGMSNAKMTGNGGMQWTRNAYSIYPNSNLPITVLKDTFSGSNSSSDKVFNLNLMATGAVQTPGGSMTPQTRTYYCNKPQKDSPSVTSTITLNPGLNKFSFTGQTWAAHPTQGVDFDVYTVSDVVQQATIANWGHDYSSNTEYNEFRAANNTLEFNENQDQLRIKGNGSFKTIILPWKKGQKPADLAVTKSGNDITIVANAGTTVISDQYYSFTDSTKTILTSFTSSSATGNNISITGGPAEVILTSNQAKITFSGQAGTRTITLPGSWTATGGITQSGSTFTYNYSSANPVTITMSGSNGPLTGGLPPVTSPGTTTPLTVEGDLNIDGTVNSLDYALLNSKWGQNYSPYDLNKDGIINSFDFAIISKNWFKTGG